MAGKKSGSEDEQLSADEIAELEPDVSWPDRKQAAALLNVSLMTVRRLEKEGVLKAYVLPGTRGGKVVYDPGEVNAARGVTTEVAEADEMNAQSLVQNAVLLSRQSGAHAERLLQLVEAPANALLEMALAENTALRARIHELEDDRINLFKVMEEARSKQHEREMDQMRLVMTNQRKDAILQLVVDNAPKLTQQMLVSGQGPQMLTSISDLAKSLSADQIGQLMGILDEKQAQTLATVLDTVGTSTGETKDEPHALLKE